MVEGKTDINKSGETTKPIYIKHLALSDWEIVEQIKRITENKNTADAIRWALRKSVNKI